MTVVSSPQLKRKIMRRAYAIHFLRKVTSPAAVKFYIELVVLWQIAARVAVSSLFANFWSALSGGGVVRYLVSALTGTEVIVQTLFVGALVIGAWFVKDLLASNKSQLAAA